MFDLKIYPLINQLKIITMKNILLLFCLCLVTMTQAQSPIWTYIDSINARLATIPYVFEGTIQSVDIFAGDNNGNKLPNSSAVWNGDVAYFVDASNNDAKGYSFATIKICKVYKGASEIKAGQNMYIQTKTFELDNVYLKRTGSGTTADTTLEFIHVPAMDGDYVVILPHPTYPDKIYFSDRFDDPSSISYSGADYVTSFHSMYEMPFNAPVDVPQSDGTIKRVDAYCSVGTLVFTDESQLELFLSQLTGIDPNPTDYCTPDDRAGTVSIRGVETTNYKIAVYPNPSTINESVKIKFDLPKETEILITLTDVTGKKIINTSIGKIKSKDYDLKTNKIENGIYFLSVSFEGSIKTFKITKN